ncbi:very-long-chain (3R)-3-hydroxyacyl-CoA dehydratase [Anastrepha obliqua]|uniref:very-long-chain (3R)-3-hydroxyacyl-CoA dehydratase n=1 Tax=Anastrepha obliqua TaxID=95512 RepID=UPI00240973FF|nr:very-long-chain (3R)-3-hydroxyacyl-CoA dehydratase [Anastrepha obliqua]XP_054744236.1 very-long-chain (3R)-3-hydroxyacyl-CoA dehydratase [Anastrepha obliqua]
MVNMKNQINEIPENNYSASENEKCKSGFISHTLHPLVYWAQTKEKISLKVDIKDSEPPVVNLTPNLFTFSSKGYGARGFNDYTFELHFYAAVNEESCTYRVFDNKVEFFIKKNDVTWWPRLISTLRKPHWLKIDFERWRTDDETIENEKPCNAMEGNPEKEFGYIKERAKQAYMLLYNFAQFIGYLYILSAMSVMYYRNGMKSIPKAYESVGDAMKFCQLLQYLEVLHPIFGYTKGGALIPFFQVTGRNFILFAMLELEPRMQTKPVVFYVFGIWSCIEIVRYPYYITQILKYEIGILTWLRYTLWIPLYPMGILCEGIIILRNLPYFEETKKMSVEMPNKWNFIFDMTGFMKIYLMLLILPGTYLVMSHMARTRAKKLNGKPARSYCD